MFVKRNDAKTLREVIECNTGMEVNDFLKRKDNPYIENLDKAVSLLQAHRDEPIYVIGDYDVDGICATAIMAYGLHMAGFSFTTRLPHRFSEGYGLSGKIIDEIDNGVVLTVDNGIAAHPAIRNAKMKGLTVIVTDHHLAPVGKDGNPVLPEADVVVDPSADKTSEFTAYCGAGVAYRFVKELVGEVPELKVLASIATVADVMPLVGTNHWLVREGLKLVNEGHAVAGLKKVIELLHLSNIDEEDYGFLIGPVFNASGRLYDAGSESVLDVLFMSGRNPMLPARAEALITANTERKEQTKAAMARAEERYHGERPAVIYDSSIGEGIIGLVAGKFCEKYQCPVICFTRTENGLLKGSGRSIPEIHLKHVLDKIQHLIAGYGGHAGAAGLSIREADLSAFTAAFTEACGEIPPYREDIAYDLEIKQTEMAEIASQMRVFAPYGEGNRKPVFRIKVRLKRDKFRKSADGKHIMYWDNGFKFIGFGMSEKFDQIGHFPTILDCIGCIKEEWYQGKRSYQFHLIDIAEGEL